MILGRDVQRLLIVLPSWVGDVVMATPVLRALREHLPDARICAAMRPGLDELLAGCPWLDETIVMRNAGLGGPFVLARAIHRFTPEAGVLLPNSFRSALTLRLSGCPIRIGFGRDGRSWMLTHVVTPPARSVPTPTLDYYALLGQAAIDVDAIDRTMQLHTTDDEREHAHQLLRGVTGKFVLLNPGASKAEKRWPAKRFATVGDALVTAHDMTIVVNGSPAEADVTRAIITASTMPDRYVNLVERGVRLGSLKAVIERAALMITNDTGQRHIAAALGTPMVSLFGPTDHRWTTLSSVHEHILLAEPFLPEELTADDHAAACVIDRIRPYDVIVASESMLAESNG